MLKFIKRSLVVATLIVAASAPAAAYATVLASGAGSGGPAQPVVVVSAPHPSAAHASFPAEGGRAAPDQPPIVVSTPRASASSSSSFQWGDAGIGAAGVLALAGIGTGAAVVIRRRARHPLAS